MTIRDRFINLRSELGLTQTDFGNAIGLSNSGISNIEKGIRQITERHIKLICSEFNVNEEWLRNGVGEMFIRMPKDFWDEYAKANGMSENDLIVLKAFMSIDRGTRDKAIEQFFKALKEYGLFATSIEDEIEREVEQYKQERIAEKNTRTSLASRAEGDDDEETA